MAMRLLPRFRPPLKNITLSFLSPRFHQEAAIREIARIKRQSTKCGRQSFWAGKMRGNFSETIHFMPPAFASLSARLVQENEY